MAKHYWRRWFVEVGVPAREVKSGQSDQAASPVDQDSDVVGKRIVKALREEFGPGYDFDIYWDDEY